jgi:hypothetical protein
MMFRLDHNQHMQSPNMTADELYQTPTETVRGAPSEMEFFNDISQRSIIMEENEQDTPN